MCINPVRLPGGQQVACHKCWQCLKRKVTDFQGRCIAEAKAAAACHVVTLTYGYDRRYGSADHMRAALLTYSDIQKYIRSWRDERSEEAPNGYPLRYFVVGEYGSMKGRAHWHAVLFWRRQVPVRPMRELVACDHWDHGHSYWDECSPATLRYVTKYVAKELPEPGAQFHCGYSRLPPLGDAWFRELALDHVRQGLAPRDLFYSFPDVLDRHGNRIRFQMMGKTRENFLRYFRDAWWSTYGDHPPACELLEQLEDREALVGDAESARRELELEKHGGISRIGRRDKLTGRVKRPEESDLRSWMHPGRVRFSEGLNVWLYEFDGEQRPWYWARNAEGVYGWRARIGVAQNPNPARPDYRERSGRSG